MKSSSPVQPSIQGYTIVEPVGSGSYSTVYKALHQGKTVAIKCVNKNRLSATGKDNIVNEIKIMKMLHHENIVEMIDFHYDDKYVYIVLEYCDGGDLSKFIRKRQKLPERLCKRFMQQLVRGLQFLQQKRICHLDLKPQNLLLKTSGQTLTLKIGDFGFSGFLSNEAKLSSIRGSPLYMAPEMLRGAGADAKADLWSVGVIFYECLFGRAPFAESSYVELHDVIRKRTLIEAPFEINSDSRDLLFKLLVYSPEDRISFEDLYEHPFLDLIHYPTEANYLKAVRLARQAVVMDEKRMYLDAFNAYCNVLQHLEPFLHADLPEERMEFVKKKIEEYMSRAEQLKVVLSIAPRPVPEDVSEAEESISLESVESKGFSVSRESKKGETDSLKTLCSSTPRLADALEIGFAAQLYLFEGQYELALEKYKSCFSIIIPLLESEPPGPRKVQLNKQVKEWMKQAESASALIAARKCSIAGSRVDGTSWSRYFSILILCAIFSILLHPSIESTFQLS